ncbi:MAG TPA: prepilin-type N-terminal cleavage/methylation domain-containing protein [bacterium]|jgi:prepilin-type N-terminal cleavage/methylation domain-containing protein|nr:prepilin-type N-terminal cleavage/methylation domain-containing protein [bacterium]HNZ51639.1 prepilin-type N-terminal cleavage/methylation domain-containing protein [bacterium]HOF79806.1 prepilin-type N-terminal cleavage/methylation domain-containing protein [bacterium]HOH85645.1 prepilin-type N-terminal cleavage/methylation domain-containing protein [bacterium]HOQ91939.1 prepilin-type N-terminal cleavage/methylation domain-containing protein [bacterium]
MTKRPVTGFTLIESMVAVAIFVLLIVSATNIFLSIVRSQRNTLSSKNAQESVSYALEVMTKELRMAKIDDGSCGAAESVYTVSADGDQIRFRNYQDICVTYSLDNGRLKIRRADDEAYMTPANIVISKLNFQASNLDIITQQPLITIRFVLNYFNTEAGQQSLQVQTSVSSRFYENYQFGG